MLSSTVGCLLEFSRIVASLLDHPYPFEVLLGPSCAVGALGEQSRPSSCLLGPSRSVRHPSMGAGSTQRPAHSSRRASASPGPSEHVPMLLKSSRTYSGRLRLDMCTLMSRARGAPVNPSKGTALGHSWDALAGILPWTHPGHALATHVRQPCVGWRIVLPFLADARMGCTPMARCAATPSYVHAHGHLLRHLAGCLAMSRAHT